MMFTLVFIIVMFLIFKVMCIVMFTMVIFLVFTTTVIFKIRILTSNLAEKG